MKFIDDNTRPLYWWNRNYFFAGTILVVLVNVIVYAVAPNREWLNAMPTGGTWGSTLTFQRLFRHFASSFAHFNWQHVLLNMLCFLICGAWLERRKGTFPLIVLVFVMAWVTGAFIGANDHGFSVGYSGVNYGFYAYAIIDYCFLFRKQTRTRFNVISGAILMGLIYFAACFSGGTSTVTFVWYPYDFMTNMGHYSGFFGGAVLGISLQLAKLIAIKERTEK